MDYLLDLEGDDDFSLPSLDKKIEIKSITIDYTLQKREKINSKVVKNYADLMREGYCFPPIILWQCTENGCLYLIDGFHRVAAAVYLAAPAWLAALALLAGAAGCFLQLRLAFDARLFAGFAEGRQTPEELDAALSALGLRKPRSICDR